jgi:hypothetical protein
MKKAAATAVAFQSATMSFGPLSCSAVACHSGEFVLKLQFLALHRRDGEIVPLGALHEALDLPIQFLMPPFQRGNVAFSRHDNSFKLLDGDIVTKNSRLVDLLGLDVSQVCTNPL